MSGTVPDVAILERLSRHAPVALRMVDVATGAPVVDSLIIEIAPRFGGSVAAMIPSRGGVWTAIGLPGLRTYEFGPDDSDAARLAAQRPFRITVRDAAGRYLPCSLDAMLPAAELLVSLPAGAALPLPPWRAAPVTSPPVTSPPATSPVAAIPLFPAPSRQMPAPYGVISADLREAASGLPAAWALLQASIDSVVCGLGLADASGRVQVLLPYPPPPPRTLTSPPSPAASRWTVDLAAFYLPAPGAVPDIPDLGVILAQFEEPRRLLSSVGSPPLVLPPLELDEGAPLVARSGPRSAPSSFLFLEAA